MGSSIKAVISFGITFIFITGFLPARAQFGIGGSGGVLYPGLTGSEKTDSQFSMGWGYEFFLQHTLFSLTDSISVDARYSFRQYKAPAELPYILTTWFTFRYLTLNLLLDFYRSENFALFSGAGASLITVSASKDFFDYTQTLFIPEINLGCKWIPSKHYTVFAEISMQYGSLPDIYTESIPLTGFRFVIGGLMFLSNDQAEK
jgi:hypothetical protein